MKWNFLFKYLKFIIVSICYLIWTIWFGNYWFLLGEIVIIDLYITQKVNWTFWKKRNGENSKFIEWLDALIFAVLAVTFITIFIFQNYRISSGSMENSLLIGDRLFVSKMAYGPRTPNTPLSFPFLQNTMPITKNKSYLEWIKLSYKRLSGFSTVKRNDIVVFNCPVLDSITASNPTYSLNSDILNEAQMLYTQDIYSGRTILEDQDYLQKAKEITCSQNEIITRPVDKKENYIKRCVAVPGDTLLIKEGILFVNGVENKEAAEMLKRYFIKTESVFNKRTFKKYGIEMSNVQKSADGYILSLSPTQLERFKEISSIDTIIQVLRPVEERLNSTFPNSKLFNWSIDDFGPLVIPGKDKTIQLNTSNLPLYSRIISVYEHNDLEVKGDSIFINQKLVESYTFKMNYYFMMGDNRPSSWDSRYWGFVPEDHIVGKPVFIWSSTDANENLRNKIRWNRFFKFIN